MSGRLLLTVLVLANVVTALGGAVKAGDAELQANPRARSAVLRIAERVGP